MEKKISFSGVDAGASSLMQKLRQSAKDLGSDMIAEARSYSQKAKEQLGFLDEQIKAIERRNRLEREGQELRARQTLSGGALQKEIQKITLESREDEMQTKLLRELIETIKLTSKEEISEERKSVEQRISAFKNDPSQFSSEDQLKLTYQEELLNRGKKGGGIMGDVFAGTFLANALANLSQKLASVASSRDEEQALGGLMSAIPLIGDLLGASYGRGREEQLQYQQARNRFGGLTGRNISTLGRYSQFGFSGSEAIGMIEGGATAAGTSNINATDFLAAGRAFSLDQGLLSDRMQVSRFSQGGQGAFLSELTRVLKASGLEGDRVLFGEILKNQTQLVREFSQSAEVVNQGIATGAIMAFNNVGGGFAMSDPRSLQRISQINQSLANPGNDLMQAENIAILRRLNPSAGVFDILKSQEQGLQTPGFIKGVLGNIQSRFGGNDQYAKLALQRRLGLSFSATEQLYNNREAIMSGSMSAEDIRGMTSGEVRAEARRRTAGLDRSAAEITDKFAGDMGAVSGTFESASKTFEKAVEEFSKILNPNTYGIEAAEGAPISALTTWLFNFFSNDTLKTPN